MMRHWYRIICLLWNHSPGSVVNHPVLNIDTWALLLITLRHRLIYEKIRKKFENKNSMICLCSVTNIIEWTRHQVCSTRTCTRPCRLPVRFYRVSFFLFYMPVAFITWWTRRSKTEHWVTGVVRCIPWNKPLYGMVRPCSWCVVLGVGLKVKIRNKFSS